MSNILVALVGNRLVQNVLFVNEFKNSINKFVFISDKKMESKNNNRSQSIIKACEINNDDCEIMIVNSNALYKIENSLISYGFNNNDNYFVNISSGTKLMAIASLNFFREYKNSQIFFVPDNKNIYRQIFPRKDDPEKEFLANISLTNYLLVNGLNATQIKHHIREPLESSKLMYKFIKYKGNIDKLPEIKYATKCKTTGDKEFYTGGWFEEYTYFVIKNYFNLSDDLIGLKIKIENKRTNNEYDVMFIYKNKLYIVECKAYYGKVNIKQKIEHDLYKISSLDQEFGLRAKSIYITTFDLVGHDIKENETLLNRAKDLNVILFQLKDLENNKFLSEII